MYLSLLKPEEKDAFLKLAYNLSNVDGSFGLEEKVVIESYRNEMNFEFDIEKYAGADSDDIINDFLNVCDERSKKIIVFELIGLAMADNKYDDKEKKLIELLSEKYGLDGEFVERCNQAILEYISFQNKLNTLIIG